MKKNIVFMMILGFAILSVSFAKGPKWKMACQAYTFNRFALSEALEKMDSLNIRYVELYPGQKMLPGDDRTTYFTMPESQIEELKALLKKHNIEAISYGVVTPDNEADWIKVFEFAQKMGIGTIVSEPAEEHLSIVDGLCQKYKIRLAIHNHPDPSRYWDPEIVAKALEGRSKYMGACTDLGHWTRSGLDATESLRKLEGRIIEIHMKDVNKTDKTGHAVIWGEGIINWDSVFAELRRQKFDGPFVIEHEHNWDNPVPDVRKSLTFFDSKVKK